LNAILPRTRYIFIAISARCVKDEGLLNVGLTLPGQRRSPSGFQVKGDSCRWLGIRAKWALSNSRWGVGVISSVAHPYESFSPFSTVSAYLFIISCGNGCVVAALRQLFSREPAFPCHPSRGEVNLSWIHPFSKRQRSFMDPSPRRSGTGENYVSSAP
jgi:hypothetical protein